MLPCAAYPWPLQDIRLPQSVCARANHPFLTPPHLHCPHYCNIIARRLRNIRPPPTTFLYAIHNTKLVLAMSCKDQAYPPPSPSSRVARRGSLLARLVVLPCAAYPPSSPSSRVARRGCLFARLVVLPCAASPPPPCSRVARRGSLLARLVVLPCAAYPPLLPF